tara:strand:- start:689 stop:916 length:228 start_codon:yes stop_codon:yes gene_type:complete
MKEIHPEITDGDMKHAVVKIVNRLDHRRKCEEYFAEHPDTVKRFTLIATDRDEEVWQAYVKSRLSNSQKSNDTRL